MISNEVKRRIDRDFARYLRDMRISPDLEDRVYVLDMREIFSRFVEYTDIFYFYPFEFHGFIETCVLATQREEHRANRVGRLYNEFMVAMEIWNSKLETFGKLDTHVVDAMGISKAIEIGIQVDDRIVEMMSEFRYIHGDYALDIQDFKWTSFDCLAIKLTYAP